MADGALLGVWGADGPVPLTCVDRPGGGVGLRGGKRLASGLGLVTHALVTARSGPEGAARMFLVDATDTARLDPDAWTASAMRPTRSGAIDLTGVELSPGAAVGGPGDLQVEPWFEGGVWRYCAAHVGGAEGLIDDWIAHLRRLGRLDDPLQRHRLGLALSRLGAARAGVEDAGAAIDACTDGTTPQVGAAVARVLLTREAVEVACVDILALAERALGMGAQDGAAPVDRRRRDLSLFLRQAAPDAKLDRAVGHVLDRSAAGLSVGEAT